MVRDYKQQQQQHVDYVQQPDIDESDGVYSDYNNTEVVGCTSNNNSSRHEEEESGQKIELLPGLEIPKRKISDDYRCTTCNKIYLGRTRMAKHFEIHPDHGSLDQLPPISLDNCVSNYINVIFLFQIIYIFFIDNATRIP